MFPFRSAALCFCPMSDEVFLAVLIERMEAARDRGFRITAATASLVIAALRFYVKERGWLKVSPANADRPLPRPERYVGPPPTIGQVRKEGVHSFTAICRGIRCGHEKLLTFDELGLPDDQVFIHIPTARRFRCTQCGGRVLRVVPHDTTIRPGSAMTGHHELSIYSSHNPDRVPPPPPPPPPRQPP